jgi:hypothetical protein
MANLVVSAVSTFDNKGLKKGQKEISAFEKNLKSLGKTFGVAFGAAALVSYGKKSVNAFMKDEAAAKSLEQQLKNTGYAFAAPDVEYYIANLQKMYGVLDDQLRPAFQTLLTASGSLTKSQKALAIALDISAGTGKSVEEVSAAIAKGYTGQTTALSRLGAGIDKTTLATGDMNLILDEASRKFSGQALARLETYAGKMDQLKVASANASEAIGKGILNALSAIGKDKNIGNITKGMENLAISIGNVITGLGVMIGKLTSIAQNSGLANLIGKLIAFNFKYSGLGLLSSIGSQANAPSSNFTYSLGSNANSEIAKLQELKARKALITTLKAEADLKKLKDKYDLERIGLMAALNQATDDETKLRLAEKLAILDGNAAMAQKYLADLEATNSTTQLANAMNQAANDILTAGQMILLGLGLNPSQMVGSTISGTAIAGFPDIRNLANVALNNPNFGTSPEAMGLGLALGFTPGSTNMGVPTEAPPINLQLVVDGSAFATAVQSAQLTNNRNGITTVPAGQGF